MTDRLPDTELDAIRERLSAATPGPWEAMCADSGHSKFELDCSVITESMGDVICQMDSLWRVTDNEAPEAKTDGRHDAWFIAHAPTDVAALLAEVERLRAEREAEEADRA